MRLLIGLIPLILLLGGCAEQPIHRKDGTPLPTRDFALSNLVKSDVDMITELTLQEALKSLRLITEKLYRRNPQEYRKAGFESPETAAARIFEHLDKGKDSPIALLNWQDNFNIAFQETYHGDRVFAFMSALTGMVMSAHDFKTKHYLIDRLSPQKMYNCARNIEVAVWKLSNAKSAAGTKLLHSNSFEGDVQNLSFEREFGKLIAQMDLIALIIEDRSNQSFSRAIQNVAAFHFLPI